MAQLNPPHYNNALDLLHRFIPTPLRARFYAGQYLISVETNDFALFPSLPFHSDERKASQPSFHWKLVRDDDVAAELEEPLFLTSPELHTISMGPACVIGVDLESREVVGFIGAAVDAQTYREFVLPVLLQMCREAVSGDRLTNLTELTEKAANV
jgi:hypothetical protein